MTTATMKQLFAEFVGTMLLVYFGIGSVVTATVSSTYVHNKGKPSEETTYLVLSSQTSALHVAFAFGIAVASIAQALGHISGAHLNPAVSFGLVAAGRFSFSNAIRYSIAQTAGATCGAGILKILTMRIVTMKNEHDTFSPGNNYNVDEAFKDWHLGASILGSGTGLLEGMLTEAILTFMLVLTVCAVTDDTGDDIKGLAPFAIGSAVFLCHVTGIAYTGSSVNPARSIGPAFFTPEENVWVHLPVYLVGPVAGGWLAGTVYKITLGKSQGSG